ncbi:hypothetical protein EDD22DRAFT_921176 [Suillus occidentalis]|nr:hypothetical protein EDD22DRAFT_921176 [Suillus occidentalis]
MILLLCVVLFFVPFLCASPPSLNDAYHILTLDATDSSSCHNRTLLDILLSCGLTLFAYTWTAIHPDILDEDEGMVAIAFRCLLLMIMAFLVPEIMVAWAAWQFLCACQVAKDFNDVFGAQHDQPHGNHQAVWQGKLATLTHGFFAWMGGFVLYVDDKPQATLAPEELLRFVRLGSVEMFVITEADIEDRSKGEVLSKCVAILQLVWFITQLIARYMQTLPVTLLEIDTLGVATLTCIAYGLWWKKPKDLATIAPPPHDSLANDKARGPLSFLRSLLFDYRRLVFSALTQEQIIIIIRCISGVVFRMIHCLGWNFLFSGHAEQKLWHVASIGIPYIFSVFLSVFFQISMPQLLARLLPSELTNRHTLERLINRQTIDTSIHFWDKFATKPTGMYIMIQYIPAHLTIIVLMMLSLRSLPPGAYDTVVWSEFIPNVSL